MDWAFYFVCGLAALLAMLVLALIVRARGLGLGVGRWARRGLTWLVSTTAAIGRRLQVVVDGARETVAYFRLHSPRAYEVPRILMLGEPGSGRRTLLTALERTQIANKVLEAELKVPRGAGWYVFSSGLVIAPGSAGRERGAWRRALHQLDEQRPERPVDGLVLTVSASLLLRQESDELERVAQQLHRQLVAVQQHWGFTLPVYLIVTQMDCVSGFGSFWRTAARQSGQMFGWSNPNSPEVHFDETQVDQLFDCVVGRLQKLQLAALAQTEALAEPEAFLLFSSLFQQLRQPLRRLCRQLFAKTAYQAALGVRGVYFCGTLEPGAGPVLLKDLFENKVFAERNLATPTEQRVWSRSRVLRRLQRASLAGFGLLFVALVASAGHLAWRVDHQSEALRIASAASPTFDPVCPKSTQVSGALAQSALTEASVSYLAMPLSWVDSRPQAARAQFVAAKVLGPLLFPALRCRLAEQATDYASAVPSTESQHPKTPGPSPLERAAALLRWEQQVSVFSELAEASPRREQPTALRDLAQLTEAVLDLGETAAFGLDNEVATVALRQLHYPEPVVADLRTQRKQMQAALLAASHLHRTRLQNEAISAVAACQRLDKNSPNLRADLETVAVWSRGAGARWALATPENNPCLSAQHALSTAIAELVEQSSDYASPELREAVDAYSPDACYAPVAAELSKVRSTWCGDILYAPPTKVESEGLLSVVGLARAITTPEPDARASALQELASASFMQDVARSAFQCHKPVSWAAAGVHAALVEVLGYQKLASQAGALSGALLPGVRQRLLTTVASHLHAAQLGAFDPQGNASAPSHLAANGGLAGPSASALSKAPSQRLEQVLPDWVQLLSVLGQLGFEPAEVIWLPCVREFALQGLSRIAGQWGKPFSLELAKTTSGEQPLFIGLSEPGAATATFQIELARLTELGQQAQPYLQLVGASPWLMPQDGQGRQLVQRLQDTVAEMLTSDPGRPGAINALREFYAQVLGGMTANNCGQRLLDLTPLAAQDEFTNARQRLFNEARAICLRQDLEGQLAKYRVVESAFQRLLRGRFPFGGLQSPDATVQDVSSMAELLASPEVADLRLGEALEPQQRFIDDLRQAVASLQRYLDGMTPLQVGVGFRSRRGSTRQDQDILSWSLESGEETAWFPNGPNQLQWHLGDRVALSLRWANRSTLRPVVSRSTLDLAVEETLANFSHGGNWGLWRLIESHREPGPTQGGVVTLRFAVPLRHIEPASLERPPTDGSLAARVYLELRLKGPDNTALAIASFPQQAPPSRLLEGAASP